MALRGVLESLQCNIATTLHGQHQTINKKLSYRKETVRLLHNIEIMVLH